MPHLTCTYPVRTLLAVVAGVVSPAITHADAAPEVYVSIVFTVGTHATPEIDDPPQVVAVAPIDLPPKVSAAAKPETSGWFTVRVDADGAVHDLNFAESAAPGGLAQPIRRALAQWRFQPLTSGGEVKSVRLPLAYRVQSVPQAANEASSRARPPRPIFRVEPTHPPELTRQSLAESDPRFTPNTPALTQRTTQVRLPNGQIQTMIVMVPNPEPWKIEFFGSEARKTAPWLLAMVVLDFAVDEAGVPRELSVGDSSCPSLEPEAAAALRCWRFAPALTDGKPSRSRLRQTMVFRIPEEAEVPRFIRPLPRLKDTPGYDEAPKFAVLALPVFPTELAARKINGTASAEVHIDETGVVDEVLMLEATTEEFGHSLRAAMLASRCVPAKTGGQRVAARFMVEARFADRPQDMPPADPHLPALLLTHHGEAPVRSSALDARPRLVVGSEPRFHLADLPAGETGSVTLEITIEASGRVREPTVITANPVSFGYTAVQAAASWLFEPPTIHGRPTAVRVRVPFTVAPAVSPLTRDATPAGKS